jgi:hypothetical protein
MTPRNYTNAVWELIQASKEVQKALLGDVRMQVIFDGDTATVGLFNARTKELGARWRFTEVELEYHRLDTVNLKLVELVEEFKARQK